MRLHVAEPGLTSYVATPEPAFCPALHLPPGLLQPLHAPESRDAAKHRGAHAPGRGLRNGTRLLGAIIFRPRAGGARGTCGGPYQRPGRGGNRPGDGKRNWSSLRRGCHCSDRGPGAPASQLCHLREAANTLHLPRFLGENARPAPPSCSSCGEQRQCK